jgi:hypothetical protein
MQESRETAYTTDITTLIDQRIAAPGNTLDCVSGQHHAKPSVAQLWNGEEWGEISGRENIFVPKRMERRFLRHSDLVTTLTELWRLPLFLDSAQLYTVIYVCSQSTWHKYLALKKYNNGTLINFWFENCMYRASCKAG